MIEQGWCGRDIVKRETIMVCQKLLFISSISDLEGVGHVLVPVVHAACEHHQYASTLHVLFSFRIRVRGQWQCCYS